MSPRKLLLSVAVLSLGLLSTPAWAGGFSFGFGYNDYPRYYRAPAYVYYDRSPVYVDYAPDVVIYDAPRVYRPPPVVVYRDHYPRYYRSTRVYTRSYGYCDYPRYSYRSYDHRPRFRGHVGARW